MKKFFTLALSCIGLFGANAQDVVFTDLDKILDDNATISFEAVVDKSVPGFINVEAGKYNTIFLKNNGKAPLEVTITTESISSAFDDNTVSGAPAASACYFGQCFDIAPASKAQTINAGEKEMIYCHASFTNEAHSECYPGKVSMKLSAKAAGQEKRTLNMNFTYSQSGISDVLAGSSISVHDNSLVYDFAKAGNYAVKIYSIIGSIVCNEALHQSGSFSLSHLNNGLYILSITDNGKSVFSQKCIVK